MKTSEQSRSALDRSINASFLFFALRDYSFLQGQPDLADLALAEGIQNEKRQTVALTVPDDLQRTDQEIPRMQKVAAQARSVAEARRTGGKRKYGAGPHRNSSAHDLWRIVVAALWCGSRSQQEGSSVMKMIGGLVLLAGGALLLPGCVAKTVYNTARLPVSAVSQATDWATVSGDEADRARGRRLREKCRERYDPYYCER